MSQTVRWGILGPGMIARKFCGDVPKSKTGRLQAVASRSKEKAEKFGEEFSIPVRHGSYEALLADKDVDAVYVATPHPLHPQWAIAAMEAGKHVLCEKPIAINRAYAEAMVETARRCGVFLMEAYMYRCHPQTARIVELIRDGAIGQVRMVQATFSFQTGPNPDSRLMKNALGGGGILDVGGYTTTMAALVAGADGDAGFLEPEKVEGAGLVGETNVDEYTAAVLRYPNDVVAQVSTGVRLGQDNSVRIYGMDGWMHIPDPWFCAQSRIVLMRKGKDAEEIQVPVDRPLYAIEADTVAESLPGQEAASPAMSWADTLANMRTLDRWRESIGLEYEGETPQTNKTTVRGAQLKRRSDHVMKYGEMPGVGKPVSRLIFGVDWPNEYRYASVMFDDFVEHGGTAFDTAYIYGGGRPERLFGHWLHNRGVRDEVVIVGKGAHTPHCNPTELTSQLHESLERMQTDFVDIYIMHRDNPEVPVGEFVDVLNEHRDAGLLRCFGGSNWTPQRMQEANDYAKKNGKQGFSLLNNNFSLARMVDPVWGGCIAASDAESRAWLEKNQMTLFAWSSQARGFFTERAAPDKRDDEELVRCWYSDDNFQRRERAIQLARRKGVLPINIALAYVLCQPFPTFALFGPRRLHETWTSLPGVNVELTPDELKWLNLEK